MIVRRKNKRSPQEEEFKKIYGRYPTSYKEWEQTKEGIKIKEKDLKNKGRIDKRIIKNSRKKK